jgi:ankyrin repeat protein
LCRYAALLAAGAEVNNGRVGGYTPLNLASESGHANLLPILIAAGASVNAASGDGTTPLHVRRNWGTIASWRRSSTRGQL